MKAAMVMAILLAVLSGRSLPGQTLQPVIRLQKGCPVALEDHRFSAEYLFDEVSIVNKTWRTISRITFGSRLPTRPASTVVDASRISMTIGPFERVNTKLKLGSVRRANGAAARSKLWISEVILEISSVDFVDGASWTASR